MANESRQSSFTAQPNYGGPIANPGGPVPPPQPPPFYHYAYMAPAGGHPPPHVPHGPMHPPSDGQKPRMMPFSPQMPSGVNPGGYSAMNRSPPRPGATGHPQGNADQQFNSESMKEGQQRPQTWQAMPAPIYPRPYPNSEWQREHQQGYWAPQGYAAGPPPPPPPPPPPSHQVDGRSGSYWPPKENRMITPFERLRDVDGREGATSPSQIESLHRDEVQHMGCTCKKTKCLKLYCQCFGVQLFCGVNCRCLHCMNTPKFMKERKEAVRMILGRNPNAFDSKFQKTLHGTNMPVAPAAAPVVVEPSKVIAHKVGCKCRKSACMKKYCECYAGNVKCNATCRCMGCKNMGSITFDPHDRPPVYPVQIHIPPPQPVMAPTTTTTGEPWQAAHNLTNLKRGSPDTKPGQQSGEVASMPSLTSSSDGTSPGETVRHPTREDGPSALLLAAVAMTEFGNISSSTTPKRNGKDPETEESAFSPRSNLFAGMNSPEQRREIDERSNHSEQEDGQRSDEGSSEEEIVTPKKKKPPNKKAKTSATRSAKSKVDKSNKKQTKKQTKKRTRAQRRVEEDEECHDDDDDESVQEEQEKPKRARQGKKSTNKK